MKEVEVCVTNESRLSPVNCDLKKFPREVTYQNGSIHCSGPFPYDVESTSERSIVTTVSSSSASVMEEMVGDKSEEKETDVSCEMRKKSVLFSNWDKALSLLPESELEMTRTCFASFCSIFSDIPHRLTSSSGVAVPLSIAHVLWRHIVDQFKSGSVEEDVDQVTQNLVQRLGFLGLQNILFNDEVIECIDFSHEMYRDYGRNLESKMDLDYEAGFVGDLMQFIGFSSEDYKDSLTNIPSPMNELYYYLMLAMCYFLPSWSKKKPMYYLLDPNFTNCRLETLGLLHGTTIAVSDVETFYDFTEESSDNIQAFECIASYVHCRINSSNKLDCEEYIELGIQVAQSFVCMARSLSRMNLNPVKYYYEALAVYENFIDNFPGLETSPLKKLLQLEMADAMQRVGNCLIFESNGLLMEVSNDLTPMNHKTFVKNYELPSQKKKSSNQVNHKAMKYYDRAFRLRRILLGNHHPLVANTLHCIGVLYFESQLYSYALSCFTEVLRVRRLAFEELDNNCYGSKSSKRDVELSIAETLEWIGHSHRELKKFHSSITALNEALLIRSIHYKKDHEDIGALYQTIGVVYEEINDYHTSLLRYTEALRIRKLCWEQNTRASILTQLYLMESLFETLSCLGNVYSHLQNIDESLKFYQEALSIKYNILHEKVPELKNYFNERDDGNILPLPVYIHSVIGNSTSCTQASCLIIFCSNCETQEEYLLDPKVVLETRVLLNIMARVFELTLSKYGDNDIHVLHVISQMSEIYIKTGNYAKASKCLKEVLRILAFESIYKQKNQTNNDKEVFRAHYRLAMCFSRLSDVDNAIKHYNLAIQELEEDKLEIDALFQIPVSTNSLIIEGIEFIETFDQGVHDETKNSIITEDVSSTAEGSKQLSVEFAILCSDIFYSQGNALLTNGQKDKAFESLLYASRLRQKLLTESTNIPIARKKLNCAYAYQCLVISYVLSTNNYERAYESLRNHVLPVYQESLEQDHIHFAHLFYYLGQLSQGMALSNSLINDGLDDTTTKLLDTAMDYYFKAMAIYEKSYPKDHIIFGHVNLSIAIIYDSKSMFTKALRCLNTTLKVYSLYNNGEHLGVPIVLNHLGIVCAAIREDSAALKYFVRSYDLRVKILGSDHITVADSLHNVGGIYAKLGYYDSSISSYKACLEIRVSHGQSQSMVAKTYTNMGIVHTRLRKYRLALENFKESIRIRKFLSSCEDDELADTYFNVANIHTRTQEYDLAVECYCEALRIRRHIYGDHSMDVANTLQGMGVMYERRNDFIAAKKCYDEAFNTKRLQLGDDDINVASTLSRVGNVEAGSGEYEEALDCYNKVLNVQKSFYGQDHVMISQTLLKIGDVWIRTGTYTTAMKCFEEALRIRECKLGETHDDVALVLYFIGKVHHIKEEFEDAMLYYGNSYRIYRKNSKSISDKDRKLVTDALRKVVVDSHGKIGAFETFNATHDCMLTMERMILDLVQILRAYIVEPTRTMVRGSLLNTMKNIIELTDQEAIVLAGESIQY